MPTQSSHAGGNQKEIIKWLDAENDIPNCRQQSGKSNLVYAQEGGMAVVPNEKGQLI